MDRQEQPREVEWEKRKVIFYDRYSSSLPILSVNNKCKKNKQTASEARQSDCQKIAPGSSAVYATCWNKRMRIEIKMQNRAKIQDDGNYNIEVGYRCGATSQRPKRFFVRGKAQAMERPQLLCSQFAQTRYKTTRNVVIPPFSTYVGVGFLAAKMKPALLFHMNQLL